MEAEIFVTPALHKTQPVPCDNWVVACRGQGVSGGYGCLIPCEGGIRFFYGLPCPSSLSGALTKYDKKQHSDERFSFSSQLQDTVHASRDSVRVKSRETWKPSCSVLSFLCCYPLQSPKPRSCAPPLSASVFSLTQDDEDNPHRHTQGSTCLGSPSVGLF